VIRVVFDTNVLVSYLLTHRPPIATLIEVYLGTGTIIAVTAPRMLEELERVLRYPRLQQYVQEQEATRFLAMLAALSEVVVLPDEVPQICRDRDDDWVIACAVAGDAVVLVTGDDDLLVVRDTLQEVAGGTVMSPAELIAVLEGCDTEDTE